jgi:hypothetical protein
VVDTLIFVLPIPFVWRLSKLSIRQRLGLVVIFGLGLVVCVVALMQIPFIRHREMRSSYFGGAINLLVAIQISLAIVAASLPDLRALFARNLPRFSPLYRRSLITRSSNNARRIGSNGNQDVEQGMVEWVDGHDAAGSGGASEATSSGELVDSKRRSANDAVRKSKTPDWLRNSLPASLMGTQVTHTEITRALSRNDTGLPARAPG